MDKFVKNTKREVSIDYIQKIVSEYFKWMSHHNLKQEKDTLSRQDNLLCFSPKNIQRPTASIGSQIGHRDHATVLHACKTVDNLSFTDSQFRKYVEDLSKIFTV